MLYDPKWEKTETKADPFTLQSLIAWLKTKRRGERYCYLDHGRCLLGQYFTACGYKNVEAFSDAIFDHADAENVPYPKVFNRIACDGERTFGAALERARAALRPIPSTNRQD